jgi:hypothetical protein
MALRAALAMIQDAGRGGLRAVKIDIWRFAMKISITYCTM